MKINLETKLPNSRRIFPVEPTENLVNGLLNYIKKDPQYIVPEKLLRRIEI